MKSRVPYNTRAYVPEKPNKRTNITQILLHFNDGEQQEIYYF